MKKDWYNNYGSGDNKEIYEGKPKDSDPYKSTATTTTKADSYGDKKKDDWKTKDYDPYKPTATATAKADSYDDKKKGDWQSKESDSYKPTATATTKADWKPKESDKPPAYGSGQKDWNQGYDDCVQRELRSYCMLNEADPISSCPFRMPGKIQVPVPNV